MRLILPFPVAAVLALAACDQGTDEVPATDAMTPEATASATAAAAATPDVAEAALPAEIPAAFQGRYGLVPADCTSTMGDAKGLLEISGDKLRFYESVGTLKEITQATEGRIRGKFAFSGEGMEWERDEVMDLRDGGKVLVRREFGEGASPEAFNYTRCV